ncbi:hypothetical protein [Veillonella parvula]|nr:hypothetical protein [Veillonella parvula]
MRIEDVLIPKNIGKKFKFNLNGQEVITEVKIKDIRVKERI